MDHKWNALLRRYCIAYEENKTMRIGNASKKSELAIQLLSVSSLVAVAGRDKDGYDIFQEYFEFTAEGCSRKFEYVFNIKINVIARNKVIAIKLHCE